MTSLRITKLAVLTPSFGLQGPLIDIAGLKADIPSSDDNKSYQSRKKK
jgi:hypothetical protein